MLTREDIIGQSNLLDRIDDLIANDNFPHFTIIVGNSKSGKKLIANYISDKLGCTFVPCSNKIDDIRDIIVSSYNVIEPMCYVWNNVDDMSVGAKNALLKVTEEPPNNAYYIMTLRTTENMLPTILSRGTTLHIQPYTNQQLKQYCNKRKLNSDNMDIVLNMCSVPGEIDILNKYNIDEFILFTNKVLDFIGQASIANTLKLSNSFILKKDETDKYDIKLFLNCVMTLCMQRYNNTNDTRYNRLCIETCNILSEFRTASVNKLSVLDKWLLCANNLFK